MLDRSPNRVPVFAVRTDLRRDLGPQALVSPRNSTLAVEARFVLISELADLNDLGCAVRPWAYLCALPTGPPVRLGVFRSAKSEECREAMRSRGPLSSA